MVVYDCLYGNYDRHEGNWSMHLHSNEEIDIYPLYDNERVLGLYENQNFIEKMLIEKEPEQIMDKIFFSRMRVPGEKKEFSTYKDMLRYLMYTYPEETQETLKRQLDSNTVQSTTSCLEQCEGLPDPYIEFGTRMYEYRNRFARRLLEHNINQDLSLKDNLSSLDHTSPNKISSFNSANLGANSPRLSLPAVCFFIIHSSLYIYYIRFLSNIFLSYKSIL